MTGSSARQRTGRSSSFATTWSGYPMAYWRKPRRAEREASEWPLIAALAVGAFIRWILIAASLTVLLVLAVAVVARAHGPAKWIQDGGYKNAVGELCCGERDCVELSSDDIEITPRGYRIKSINEIVPFAEATPSPTGTYWRCYWGGKRKCFFAPPGSV